MYGIALLVNTVLLFYFDLIRMTFPQCSLLESLKDVEYHGFTKALKVLPALTSGNKHGCDELHKDVQNSDLNFSLLTQWRQ